MNDEGVFPRLLELLQVQEQDVGLHKTLLLLFFEMSRIQRIRHQDLSKFRILCCERLADTGEVLIEDEFVNRLFQIIEGLSDDVSDPYHYPIIRVLVRIQTVHFPVHV